MSNETTKNESEQADAKNATVEVQALIDALAGMEREHALCRGSGFELGELRVIIGPCKPCKETGKVDLGALLEEARLSALSRQAGDEFNLHGCMYGWAVGVCDTSGEDGTHWPSSTEAVIAAIHEAVNHDGHH